MATDGIYRIRVATKGTGEDEEYVSTVTKAVSIVTVRPLSSVTGLQVLCRGHIGLKFQAGK